MLCYGTAVDGAVDHSQTHTRTHTLAHRSLLSPTRPQLVQLMWWCGGARWFRSSAVVHLHQHPDWTTHTISDHLT
jgi:hypothetical protein